MAFSISNFALLTPATCRELLEANDRLEVLFEQVRNVDALNASPTEMQRIKVQFMENILALQNALSPLVSVVRGATNQLEATVFQGGLAEIA